MTRVKAADRTLYRVVMVMAAEESCYMGKIHAWYILARDHIEAFHCARENYGKPARVKLKSIEALASRWLEASESIVSPMLVGVREENSHGD